MRTLSVGAVLAIGALLAFGCGGGGGDSCATGSVTCECYPNDTCDSGLLCLSGLCVQNPGSAGPSEDDTHSDSDGDPCDGVSCGDHGDCNPGTGSCECEDGFSGATCNQCGCGNYPNCYPCKSCPGNGNCNGHGKCDDQAGICSSCNAGFNGSDCGQCATGYCGYPNCHQPPSCPLNCSGHGDCDVNMSTCTATCNCDDCFSGASCNQCTPGCDFNYPNCHDPVACPGGGDCNGHGDCDHDSGTCTKCDKGYKGASCGDCDTGNGYQACGNSCCHYSLYSKSNVSVTVDKFCGPGEFTGGDQDFDSSKVNETFHAWVERANAVVRFCVDADFKEDNSDWTEGHATRCSPDYPILPPNAACDIQCDSDYYYYGQTQQCDVLFTDDALGSTLVQQINFYADTDGDDVGNCEPMGAGSGSGCVVKFMTVSYLCQD